MTFDSRRAQPSVLRHGLEWMLAHRRTTILALAIVSAAFLYLISLARPASSLGDMIFGDMPEYQRSLRDIGTLPPVVMISALAADLLLLAALLRLGLVPWEPGSLISK